MFLKIIKFKLILIKRSSELNKKLLIVLTLIFIKTLAFTSPKLNFFWQPGELGITKSTQMENLFSGVGNIAEVYCIEEKTGLFASISPFNISLNYTRKPDNSEPLQQWTLDSMSLVNIKLGWLKVVGEYFMIEPFAKMSALNPCDLSDINFVTALELSFHLDLFSDLQFPDIGKIVSLELGASYPGKNQFKPELFASIKLNFLCITLPFAK